MDNKLKKLISAYQARVRMAVELIQRSGIPLPATAQGWVETPIPASGALQGGVAYDKHGIGCWVDLPAGAVDFDFGRFGEIDGFDCGRLVEFAGVEFTRYGFDTKEAIEKCFETAVWSGSLVPSGNRRYYTTQGKRILARE